MMFTKGNTPPTTRIGEVPYLAMTGFGALSVLVEVEPPSASLHVIDARHNPAAEDCGEVERIALDGKDSCYLKCTTEGVGTCCGLQGEDEFDVGLRADIKLLLRRHAPDGAGTVNDVEAVDRHM